MFPSTRGGIRWVLHYTPRPRPLPSQARPSQAPGAGPCAPPCCPSAGTSVAPLVPLARSLGAWLALPGPSRWLLRTIRLGYAIQFARRPPKFRGVHFTSVKAVDAPCPVCGNRSPAGEGCDRTGPSSRYEVGVLQPLLHCAQEKRWVTTDLGSASFEPCTSQAAVQNVDAETHFRVRPSPRLVAAIDLKDAYFHVSILPRHRPFLRFASRVGHISTRSCPSGCPCRLVSSPKSRRRPLFPWGERGVRILNYLDDWLILAQSREQLRAQQGPGAQAPQPVGPSGQLGKEQTRANTEDLFSRHGVGFGQPDSTPHPGTCSVGAELPQDFIRQDGGPLKLFQRLLGHMAAAAAIVPLGLLHMRPLQHWLHGRIPRWAWERGTHRVQITPACRKTFSPWSDPSFLRAGVPLEQVSRHAVVFTDASATGWGATYNGHAVLGSGRVPNCVGISIASSCWQYAGLEPPQRAPSGQGRSGPYGQHCDRLRISTGKAVYAPVACRTRPPPPPLESEASEVPSCHPHPRSAQPGSRRAVSSSTSRGVETPSSGGPADLESVRSCSGRPVCISGNHPLPVVLLPNRGNARHGCTGTQLAPGPAQICVPPSEPTSTDTVQDQGGRGAGLVSSSILAQQDLVPGNSCSSRQPLPGRFLWGRICFLRDGAPSGTRVQTCGNSMCGPWTGRGGSRWPTPGGSSHYCFSTSTVHKTGLCAEVEPVRRMVFLSPWGPPEMFDQSRAVLPAARVGA